jgi:hypothetical protein
LLAPVLSFKHNTHLQAICDGHGPQLTSHSYATQSQHMIACSQSPDNGSLPLLSSSFCMNVSSQVRSSMAAQTTEQQI